MRKYKIYKIENKNGVVISNHENYTKIGNAKNAANNCIWRMDEDTHIVEYEITETPVSRIKINVAMISQTSTRYDGILYRYTHNEILGYDLDKNLPDNPVKTEDKISFNK